MLQTDTRSRRRGVDSARAIRNNWKRESVSKGYLYTGFTRVFLLPFPPVSSLSLSLSLSLSISLSLSLSPPPPSLD